jgi:hypothetical protein
MDKINHYLARSDIPCLRFDQQRPFLGHHLCIVHRLSVCYHLAAANLLEYWCPRLMVLEMRCFTDEMTYRPKHFLSSLHHRLLPGLMVHSRRSGVQLSPSILNTWTNLNRMFAREALPTGRNVALHQVLSASIQ